MNQDFQSDNQLYEWSIRKILAAAGVAIGALIAKGVKTAINSAAVKANKGKMDQILADFKERIYADVEKRAAKYAADLDNEEGSGLTKEKKRAFQKALLDYVKKEISALGKKVFMKIDKAPAGQKGKESLKVYWETITTSVELDLLEKLHKLNIIGEEDRDAMTDKVSADLEKIINVFLKKFGVDPDQEPKLSEFKQLKDTFNGIKGAYKTKNSLEEDALDELVGKIDIWKEFYEKVKDKLSSAERTELSADLEIAEKMKENLKEQKNDIINDKKINEYNKTLFDYMETLFDNRAKYIKSSFDVGTYQEFKDLKKLKKFTRFVVGEIMDDPDLYEKQEKLLKSQSISDKNLIVLFLKVFLSKYEEYEESQNESFMSFYDYKENYL